MSKLSEPQPFRLPSAIVPLLLLLLAGCGPVPTPTASQQNKELPERCPAVDAVETEGMRRLALIVGVGEYASPGLTDLRGPTEDARRVYQLLTDEVQGYGFPKSNVCMLLDGQATTERFREAFEQTLVQRARTGDVAVLYFAGHGSQAADQNGDEADQRDETLLLHDARTGSVEDFLDDELNSMLGRLHAQTERITVILDSCSSGSATRAGNTFQARWQPAAASAARSSPSVTESGGWLPDALPGLVSFSAASDGTPALETGARGIFTDALLLALAPQGHRPLTYAQAARRIRPLVSARSYQIPYFQGDLETVVFANEHRRRSLAWEVTTVGESLELSGPPLPGMGPGAELRIYDGAVDESTARDPAQAKATAVVETEGSSGVGAFARIVASRAESPEIREGDLAVLVRPGDAFLRLKVRIRPRAETGGVTPELAKALKEAVAEHPEAANLIQLSSTAGDFELLRGPDGQLGLWGPHRRRNLYGEDGDAVAVAREVADDLWRHARQKALLALQGEGGGDFEDHRTLQVELVPASDQTVCAEGPWLPAGPNEEQVVPLCHRWNVRVRLAADTPVPLLVGGLVLSTDGGILAFPRTGRTSSEARPSDWYVKLEPGEEHVFRRAIFEGRPPLGVQDKVLVFGTQESNPVAWHLLAETAPTRSAASTPQSPLFRALDRYLRPGTRGQVEIEDSEVATWTLSSITLRVETAQPTTSATADSTSDPTGSDSLSLDGVCDPGRHCGHLRRRATSEDKGRKFRLVMK